ncbi:MAG: asparagine synthase (glutamine-hydrolyzing), partial [Planctomycetota bacterium]
EVYNFPALRAELEAEGGRFESHGDAAVVLKALHRWGPKRAIPRFDGMFAFAYLDRRDQTLWLARDRFGIKSLSIARRDGLVLFSSEIKALFAHPAVRPMADRGAAMTYMVYRRLQPGTPLFEGVRILAPGTWVRLRDGVEEEREYRGTLSLIEPERVQSNGHLAPDDAFRAIHESLRESVRSHLVSDAPLAAMCSGGVDSSLLTALIRDERPDLEAFVADVGGEVNEYPQAARVAKHLRVRLHRVVVDRERYLRLWPQAIWHRDLPSMHPSDPAMLAVTHACRDAGFKVLLTGEGADEIFGGYNWYAAIHRRIGKARRAARYPWLFRRAARRWKRYRDLPHTWLPAPDDAKLRFRLAAAIAPETELFRLAARDRFESIEPPEDRAVLTAQLDDLRFHLDWILQRHDRIGMAASIESRVPFLSNSVADLGLHLPMSLKLRRRVAKWALKKVAETRLPRDVVHAAKKGFVVSPHLYAGTEGLLLGGYAADLLRWTGDETRRIIAIAHPGGTATYQLVCLEIWARLFLGGQSPDEISAELLAL